MTGVLLSNQVDLNPAPVQLDVDGSGQLTRVDYHCHTEYSYDSETSLEAVLERAVASGLRVLGVADHHTIAGAQALRDMGHPDIEIIVGCEFTTTDGSQIIGMGLDQDIAARELSALIAEIKRQGGLVMLPHPFRRGSGIFRDEMRRSDAFIREVLAAADLTECFNGRDSYTNNQRSRRFALEHGLNAVAGSDAHTADEIGSVFTEYTGSTVIHGVSPRRISFPTQLPRSENPARRRLLESYHRNESRLPAFVRRTYRASRRRLVSDAPQKATTPTEVQYELPP